MLPNKTLQDLNALCNRFMGPTAKFPGVAMPPLPFKVDSAAQLGSYLTTMSMLIQRLLPFMQRTGDLLTRESLMTNVNARK